MAENLPTTTDNLTFAFSLFNVSLLIMTRQPKSRGETRNGRSETLTAHTVRIATYFGNKFRM